MGGDDGTPVRGRRFQAPVSATGWVATGDAVFSPRLAGFVLADPIPPDELLALPCELLVPAAGRVEALVDLREGRHRAEDLEARRHRALGALRPPREADAGRVGSPRSPEA